MRRKVLALIALIALAVIVLAFGPDVADQYQRAKMKTTITRMRVLGTVLDAERKYVGTCGEAGKAIHMKLRCTDAWGEPVYLMQSKNDPTKYIIWCRGISPETAAFVYQPEGFTRLPKDAPP
jgi:hypothetical protein